MSNFTEGYRADVKEIDEKIRARIKDKLKIEDKFEQVDIIGDTEKNKIIKNYNRKKESILLMFEGDFSENEFIINEKKEQNTLNKIEDGLYSTIANRYLSKGIEKIIASIEDENNDKDTTEEICFDRKNFLLHIIDENIEITRKDLGIEEQEEDLSR